MYIDLYDTQAPECGYLRTEWKYFNVTPQNCLKCHGGSYEKLAEQTAGGDINYHNTHLGPIACTECHQGHKPPKLVCDQCHEFSVKVP